MLSQTSAANHRKQGLGVSKSHGYGEEQQPRLACILPVFNVLSSESANECAVSELMQGGKEIRKKERKEGERNGF